MAEKTPTNRTSAATCVCRTCNGNIISKNHPLDLFGEKAIKEGIAWDLEIFSRVKISLDAGFPSWVCRTCYLKVTTFQELVKMVLYSKAQKRKDCTRKPVLHHFTRCGTWEKKEQGQLVGTYVTQNLFYFLRSCLQCNCVNFGTGDNTKIKAQWY